MMKNNLTSIGLNSELSQKINENLNILLANYQVLYMNTRGFHWNIKGDNFFELHLKFEELYNNFQIKIDDIAERILTLGGIPMHTYSEYLKTSNILETKDISNGKDALKAIVESFQAIIVIQRNILTMTNDANDEGTNALMSDNIREQEKLIWMFSSYLKA